MFSAFVSTGSSSSARDEDTVNIMIDPSCGALSLLTRSSARGNERVSISAVDIRLMFVIASRFFYKTLNAVTVRV